MTCTWRCAQRPWPIFSGRGAWDDGETLEGCAVPCESGILGHEGDHFLEEDCGGEWKAPGAR